MSAQQLHGTVVKDLAERRDIYAALCTERTAAALDEIRLNQGIALGLKLAIEIMNDRANNLYG